MLQSWHFVEGVLWKPEFGARCLSVFIDKAHCWSHWGADFWKKYGSIEVFFLVQPHLSLSPQHSCLGSTKTSFSNCSSIHQAIYLSISVMTAQMFLRLSMQWNIPLWWSCRWFRPLWSPQCTSERGVSAPWLTQSATWWSCFTFWHWSDWSILEIVRVIGSIWA